MPLNKIFLEGRYISAFTLFTPLIAVPVIFHFLTWNRTHFVFCLFSIFDPLWLRTLMIYLSLIKFLLIFIPDCYRYAQQLAVSYAVCTICDFSLLLVKKKKPFSYPQEVKSHLSSSP